MARKGRVSIRIGTLLKRLLRVLDSYLPSGPREFDHAENLYRARVMVLIPLGVGLANMSTCVLLYRHLETLGPYAWVFWVSLLSTLLLLYSVLLFLRTGALGAAANIYALGATLSVVSVVLATGGFEESPLIIMLPLVMIFTFIMTNMGTALFWAGAGLLVWLVGIQVDGLQPPNLIPPEWRRAALIATVVNAGVVIMCVLWFFDLLHRQLLRRLQLERDRALFTAAHDPLTGLANRNTFDMRLVHMVEHQRVSGCQHALLLVDLDDFKRVNDSHGHIAGDAVLKAVAARLKSCVRHSDLAARLGGDEFGLLLFDVGHPDNLIPILDKLHRAVIAPVDLTDGGSVSVGASIGVAMIPDDGDTQEELLHRADLAMYQAKDTTSGYLFVRDMIRTSAEEHGQPHRGGKP